MLHISDIFFIDKISHIRLYALLRMGTLLRSLLQFALEQHGLNYTGPLRCQSFSVVGTTRPHNPQFVESAVTEEARNGRTTDMEGWL